ncbi:MAG: hypothetical protein ACYTEP_04615 [Planctomycetota bacterium]|jgi:hypothetical protein
MITTILFTTLQSSVPQPLALLDDGTRLLVLDEVEVGSYLVRTPYGVLRSDGQCVIELSDSTAEAALLEPLRDLDYATWVARLSERGLLDRLVLEPMTEGNRELLMPVLAEWGQRIDPLSPTVPAQDRVAQIWQRLLEAEGGRRGLLLGALEREIAIDPTATSRQLEFASWHAAMNDAEPTLRWSATRVATILQDPGMAEALLANSLQDKEIWTSMAGAKALMQMDPEGAMLRWARHVADNGESSLGRRAALLLGSLGPDQASRVRQLIDRLRSFSLSSGGSCGTASLGTLGLPVTEDSPLETELGSNLEKLLVADILDRATVPGQQVDPSSLDPRSTPSDPEEALSEAWRMHLMGR